ncbi:hypothetical protein HZY97_20350 [Sphingomonas sp. R-74633]|uniref:hypothetical protein n=1 Tax=Sphingomonas sp. R-74633 TaxID=2751188 RepID=UPI0015D22C3A|nr:hypothetical protein [Sphingomonas sp. R-74633]NYT43138.1 hypothetical protein [Sphingomonas sp. R-74633]
MTLQLDLFARQFTPAMREPVQPHGRVLQSAPDEMLSLAHPKMAWRWAEIELHQHVDGRWMWSTSFNTNGGGSGYRVGEKWGHFAASRDDALHYAIEEMREHLGRRHLQAEERKSVRLILEWLETLQ